MGLTGWWAAGRSQPDQSGRCKVEHPFPPDQDGSRSPAKQKKAQLHAPAYIISNLQLFTIIFRPLNSRMIHDRPTSWPAPLETHQPLSDDVNANSEINQKLPRLKAGKVYKCPNATFFRLQHITWEKMKYNRAIYLHKLLVYIPIVNKDVSLFKIVQ